MWIEIEICPLCSRDDQREIGDVANPADALISSLSERLRQVDTATGGSKSVTGCWSVGGWLCFLRPEQQCSLG